MASLQAQLQAASTHMQSADDTAMPTSMQPGEHAAMPTLHSVETRSHIVTHGNWASSSIFVNHYQRNQIVQEDFTPTVLSDPLDQLHDAQDNFSLD